MNSRKSQTNINSYTEGKNENCDAREYHKTKDILHVMQLLGHKNIKNTLIYTQLVNVRDDEFVSRVAKNVKEACQLIESGFEYVCDVDDYKVFRKRK